MSWFTATQPKFLPVICTFFLQKSLLHINFYSNILDRSFLFSLASAAVLTHVDTAFSFPSFSCLFFPALYFHIYCITLFSFYETDS